MSYKNNSCSGWNNPSSISSNPVITSLSSYFSPLGATPLVVINGVNFRSYSVISFGGYYPSTIFISSDQIQFYVPNSVTTTGNYPVQIFNDIYPSNIVNYYLDNASGFWLLNNSSQTIGNTNTNGVEINGNLTLNYTPSQNNTSFLGNFFSFPTDYINLPVSQGNYGTLLSFNLPVGVYAVNWYMSLSSGVSYTVNSTTFGISNSESLFSNNNWKFTLTNVVLDANIPIVYSNTSIIQVLSDSTYHLNAYLSSLDTQSINYSVDYYGCTATRIG
jgi:hypothetical protein